MQVGPAEIAILSQYLAPSCSVNHSSGKCNTLSCDGPWRVDDTSRCKRWSLLMAGDNDEAYDKRHNIMLKT